MPKPAYKEQAFETHLEPTDRRLVEGLDSPASIQDFLNTLAYSEDEFYRCPKRVVRERKANCFDGALLAAAALRRIGYPPLILELIPNERDDDHLLALFKRHGRWGAMAQSNFTGLRYREPIYRDLRELVMSYFDDFFNSAGEKTLRGYRGPVNLSVFDRLDWTVNDAGLVALANGLDRYRARAVLSDAMAAGLAPVDERSLSAGLLGANPDGLFKLASRGNKA